MWDMQGEARVLPSVQTHKWQTGIKDSAGSVELREGSAVSLCQQRGWAAVTAPLTELRPVPQLGGNGALWSYQLPTPEIE